MAQLEQQVSSRPTLRKWANFTNPGSTFNSVRSVHVDQRELIVVDLGGRSRYGIGRDK